MTVTARARAAKLAAHLPSFTYNAATVEEPAGWSAGCSCGADTGTTRYPSMTDARASYAGHLRRAS